MPHVLSLRDTFLNSTLGYAASVKARVPKSIPKELVPLALQQGCVLCGPSGEQLDPSAELIFAPAPVPPVKDADSLGLDQDPETDPAPPADVIAEALEVIRQQKAAAQAIEVPLPTGAPPPPSVSPLVGSPAYRAAIAEAIKALIVEGNTDNFKKDGTPTQRAIDRTAGFKVDPLELIEVMAEVSTTD